MKPPLIDFSTFCDALPAPMTDGQEQRAKTLVQWVSAFARREARTEWLLLDGTLGVVPDDVLAVVTQAAVRSWLARTGVISEQIGPTSVTFDRQSASGIYFTPSELAVLRSYRQSANVGLWTLTTTRGDDELPVFFTDSNGDEMLAMFAPEDWPNPS